MSEPSPVFKLIEEIGAEYDKRDAENRAKLRGIQARLFNNLKFNVVSIPFKDEGGDFAIQLRVPSPRDRKRLFELSLAVRNAKTAEELDRISAEIAVIIGRLCVDPDLGAAFWVEGGDRFSAEVPARLISVAMGLETPDAEATGSFRSKP